MYRHLEAAIPGLHGNQRLALEVAPDVRDDVARAEVWDVALVRLGNYIHLSLLLVVLLLVTCNMYDLLVDHV